MTKNRLRYSKGKDLLQYAHKSRYEGEFTFPPEAARKIARQQKEFFGKAKYTRTENSDPVLTKALELEGIFFRTPEEEHSWQNSTPEERQRAFERHAQRRKELIEQGKIVDLDAKTSNIIPTSSNKIVFNKDIDLSR